MERAYEAFSRLDWADPELSELQTLFLRAARVVDDRSLDVPRSLRDRIAARLEKMRRRPAENREAAGISCPFDRSERLGLFGEFLPPGLILSEE